jgi:TonB family protein
MVFESCKRPVYPPEAMRNQWTGVVRLRFSVSSSGEVTGAEVLKSSGYEVLDHAAKQALSECPFKPAVEDGVAIDSNATLEYVWKLD